MELFEPALRITFVSVLFLFPILIDQGILDYLFSPRWLESPGHPAEETPDRQRASEEPNPEDHPRMRQDLQ